uniref:Uncharacterized protein n=1 Tax=Anguilla anguilla TaxID=7936 RepID=A0A0E9XZ91_ANGAN
MYCFYHTRTYTNWKWFPFPLVASYFSLIFKFIMEFTLIRNYSLSVFHLC